MQRRWQIAGTLLVSCVLLAGCGRRELEHKVSSAKETSVRLTDAQEAAVREYVGVLEKQIALIEQTGEALASVKADHVSKDKARAKCAALALEMDVATKHVREHQPKDIVVLEAAQHRVMERLGNASKTMQAEVTRITRHVEGGQEWFDKELRQTLNAIKGPN
jgi:hypothetical protein